jgi:hypothetical protein
MTQPYGQQPPPGGNYPGSGGFQQPDSGGFQQPGGNYPGSGGFQQPGGNYPGSGGFPQAPQAPAYQQGYGGMPQAPQEYGGPTARPGVATASAVLAFVQAGITAVTTILLFAGLANANGGDVAVPLLIGLAQAAGVVLLIFGAVQLMGGKARTLLIVGCALELAICLAYIIISTAIPSLGIDALQSVKAGLIAIALFFAIMPAISLVLALGQQATQFLQSRRGRA